jgi:hypothetical protein
VAGTGKGKTTLVDWLIDILGDAFIITPKKKPPNWCGLKVYGCTPKMFNFDAILKQLQWVQSEMYQRYDLIHKGEEPLLTNFVVDEWRLINKNIPEAKEIMKEIITVAREANLRMIALAPGMQVKTWGFEDESDLEECFSDILIGDFAISQCLSLRRKHHKQSEEYAYWTEVLTFFKHCIRPCMVANQPAIIPDLSNWQRDIAPKQDDAPLLPSEALGEPLRTIWKFCKEQGDWVATRDLLRKGFSTLQGVNTEKLKEYFLILEEKGYGEIDLSGTSVKFKVF